MKKVIILKNNGGRLANQLWSFASIYAYCLEKRYTCTNYVFFRYQKYFCFKSGNWYVDNVLSKLPFFIARIKYAVLFSLFGLLMRNRVIDDKNQEFLLSPSQNQSVEQNKVLERMESDNENIYFRGWLFRNPVGLERYHGEIKKYFRPNSDIERGVAELLDSVRDDASKIVGVHIRLGDYKNWQGGKYYFSFKDVRKILDNFLAQQSDPKQIKFIICTDGEIDKVTLEGLNYIGGIGSAVGDLYALAETDIIIGSNSTYGLWASYYGGIPFVQFSRQPITWPKLI